MMLAESLDFVLLLLIMEERHVSAASYFLYGFLGNLEHWNHLKKVDKVYNFGGDNLESARLSTH